MYVRMCICMYDVCMYVYVRMYYVCVCMYVCMYVLCTHYVCIILTLTGMFVDKVVTFARSEVLGAVWLTINVMWDVTLCCWVCGSGRFE